KQVFDSISYTPAPLPPAEAEVMDMAQARKIIRRFAADDAAFFNFIHSIKPSCHLPTPLQSGHAMVHFKRYTCSPHPQFEIPLSDQKLKITPEDTSGQAKVKSFVDLLKTALKCRKEVEAAESPSSPAVIKALKNFSKAVEEQKDQGLILSDEHFDQIKNLTLPINPADPMLGAHNRLQNVYFTHFSDKTKPRGAKRPLGISGL
ncbi:MAG: hypothetical protein ACQEQL_02240, partial [Pseudomonadota bacterium]